MAPTVRSDAGTSVEHRGSGKHTVELLFGRRRDRNATRDAVRAHFPEAQWKQFGGPGRAAWADWRTGWRGEEPW